MKNPKFKQALREFAQRRAAPGADLLPDVHYGVVGEPPPDWRKHVDADDLIDDDSEPVITPDVVEQLGFDPLQETDIE